MRKDYIHGLGIVRTVDHSKNGIDWQAMAVWILFAILLAWGGVREWKYYKISQRIDYVELFQGPKAETPYTVVNGKISLTQSPYSGVYFENTNGKKYIRIYKLQIFP